ncbi:MAG: hypothetical protein FWC79_03970 [Oscillospiraceae bacterium]|nr:hypothetical protein [Oscillospiraceae bacterium]
MKRTQKMMITILIVTVMIFLNISQPLTHIYAYWVGAEDSYIEIEERIEEYVLEDVEEEKEEQEEELIEYYEEEIDENVEEVEYYYYEYLDLELHGILPRAALWPVPYHLEIIRLDAMGFPVTHSNSEFEIAGIPSRIKRNAPYMDGNDRHGRNSKAIHVVGQAR